MGRKPKAKAAEAERQIGELVPVKGHPKEWNLNVDGKIVHGGVLLASLKEYQAPGGTIYGISNPEIVEKEHHPKTHAEIEASADKPAKPARVRKPRAPRKPKSPAAAESIS